MILPFGVLSKNERGTDRRQSTILEYMTLDASEHAMAEKNDLTRRVKTGIRKFSKINKRNNAFYASKK